MFIDKYYIKEKSGDDELFYIYAKILHFKNYTNNTRHRIQIAELKKMFLKIQFAN